MDEFEMTENTIETEATDYEETVETSNGGSGLIGALIGGAVVAVGAAAVNAIKKNEKVRNFLEAKRAARHQKAEDKWFREGIKKGFITPAEAGVEDK